MKRVDLVTKEPLERGYIALGVLGVLFAVALILYAMYGIPEARAQTGTAEVAGGVLLPVAPSSGLENFAMLLSVPLLASLVGNVVLWLRKRLGDSAVAALVRWGEAVAQELRRRAGEDAYRNAKMAARAEQDAAGVRGYVAPIAARETGTRRVVDEEGRPTGPPKL